MYELKCHKEAMVESDLKKKANFVLVLFLSDAPPSVPY
jgi:hypothetical protein